MKFALSFSLLAISFISIAQAAPNAEKVAAALNALDNGDALEAENGRLRLKSAPNNKEQGFEDCRNLAINHAILDVYMGEETAKLAAKGSHRILLTTGDEDKVRGMVDVKVGQVDGFTAERTYSYLMSDGTDKYCDLKANEGFKPGMRKRKDLEKEYLNSYIPTLSAADIDALKKKTKTKSLEDLSKEAVKKLMKSECTDTALNKALAASTQAFQDKFNAKAIPYFMFKNSSLIIVGTKADAKVRVAMTDGEGVNKLVIDSTLVLVEKDEGCDFVSLATAEATAN